MEIRAFRFADDAAACLAMYDSCFPDEGGGAARREAFARFLQEPASSRYFVAEHNGAIAGSGGFLVDLGSQTARLEWALVQPALQRQGLGRYLLLYRLKEIGRIPGIDFVEASVPARLSGYYSKNGLKAISTPAPESGWSMQRMKLQVCAAG